MENRKMETNNAEISELKRLGLEIYETDTETMLEEMGASNGGSGCCSVIIISKN